ncbi:type III polyketide synthase [soil metagenome]
MTTPPPTVRGLATAVPPFKLEQAEARALARHLFEGAFSDVDRLLSVFDNAGIQSRYVARPLEWFGQAHTFEEKNAVYAEVGLELACRAACRALRRAGADAGEVGAVVFVSSTGLATPSLDAYLIQRLGLPRSVHRLPLWGLGCAGGAAGLARAADLARALPGKSVLLVAVELCSVTFIRGDKSKSNLVGSGLFADGAAAVLVGPGAEGQGPELLSSSSRLFDASDDIMGWDVVEGGLKVRFSRDIPSFVQENLGPTMREALAESGLGLADLEHFVVHPGGPKVLDAYERCLDLEAGSLDSAREVLRDYGNMSSPTVLFVLERYLNSTAPTGAPGTLFALGPGFSAEQVLFRW